MITDPDDRPARESLPGPQQLQRERDTAVQAGLLLADRLQRAAAGLAVSRAAIAALRADRSWQQAAVLRVLTALGICAAISILWH